jgi:VWFA-related protein
LDGVYVAMDEMRTARNARKAILILSDGEENSSRYTQTEINNRLRETDVQVYAIGVTQSSPGNGLLAELARETGGRAFRGVGLNDLPDAVSKIGIELRSQYMLGYRPANTVKDGKYRQVEVLLNQPRGLPPLRAYYRTGYYAPAQ